MSLFRGWGYAVSATVAAGLFGSGAGMFMARFAPDAKHSWLGLAFVPVWLLIEIGFEIVVEALSVESRYVRVATAIAVLVGFYSAWFVVRT